VLRRRQRLGLADAVVVDRMRLWAMGSIASSTVSLVVLVMELAGVDPRASAQGALVIGSLGLVAAVCMWLAFLPPARYTNWVQRRAHTRAHEPVGAHEP
jgi:hypothetical protein